jgi:hypothetical protein
VRFRSVRRPPPLFPIWLRLEQQLDGPSRKSDFVISGLPRLKFLARQNQLRQKDT